MSLLFLRTFALLMIVLFFNDALPVLIDDFSQLNQTVVSEIAYPESNQDMQNLVKRAVKEGKKISVAGKRHSQGGHAFYPDAIVIDINSFNKILNLNLVKKIITVQTGVTWEQIQECINPHGLAIKVMQTTQIFTVGGSLSVNAHGRDPRYSALIETVQAIRILLSSGQIVNASRSENSELFRLAIGGYGLFGIILEADIELTDNVVYDKHAQVISIDQYETFVKEEVIANPSVGLHYGIVSLAPYHAFKKMLVVNYTKRPSHKNIPRRAYRLQEEKHIFLSKLGLTLKSESPWFTFFSEVGEWPLIVAREKLSHVTCRNNAMRHPALCLDITAKSRTYVLQSHFIPTEKFTDFMNFLHTCAHEKDLALTFVFTRYIPKNTESYLHYTTQDYFEIVLLINHGVQANSIEHAKHWTQKLIDVVLSYGGRFYLPGRLYATDKQIHIAYPQIDEFFAKKRMYDPQMLFMNCFYQRYNKALNV